MVVFYSKFSPEQCPKQEYDDEEDYFFERKTICFFSDAIKEGGIYPIAAKWLSLIHKIWRKRGWNTVLFFKKYFIVLPPHYLKITQNVNVARFARNVEWDSFCDVQTPCYPQKALEWVKLLRFGVGNALVLCPCMKWLKQHSLKIQ